MHLREIGIKNFRIFRDLQHFQMAPLTFLTGPNDSGKSTLIKLILLLKDTYDGMFTEEKIKDIQKYLNGSDFKKDNENSDNSTPESLDSSYISQHVFPLSLNFSNKSNHFLGSSHKNLLPFSKGKKEIEIQLPFIWPEFKDIEGSLILKYTLQKEKVLLSSININSRDTSVFQLLLNILDNNQYSIKVRINLKYLETKFQMDALNFHPRDKYDEQSISDIVKGLFYLYGYPESKSALKEFGFVFYPYLPEEKLQKDNFYNVEKKERKNHSSEILILQNKFFNSITEEDGILSFNLPKFSLTSGVPSALNLINKAFQINLIKDHCSNLTNCLYYISDSSAAAELWAGYHNSLLKEDLYIEEIPIEHSPWARYIIGLIDRSIGFNNIIYSALFKSIHYSPDSALRYEKLITADDKNIFNILEESLKIKDFSKEQELNKFKPLLFVNESLSLLNLKKSLSIEMIKDYGYELRLDSDFYSIPLKNSGYGIRKILSLILQIAAEAYKNFGGFANQEERYGPSVFIIEEPETNLHPKYQSILADIFSMAADYFNMQFIIETHSEYMIRKTQYLVAKNDNNLKAEHIMIYYFKNPEELKKGDEQVYELGMRPDGMLKRDFGYGFFDESVRLTIDLLKVQNNN